MLLKSLAVIVSPTFFVEPNVVCQYPLVTEPVPMTLNPVPYGVLTSVASAVVPDPAISYPYNTIASTILTSVFKLDSNATAKVLALASSLAIAQPSGAATSLSPLRT